MKIAMWWGNTYIMTFEAYTLTEFIEKSLGHLEKYWENLINEDFSNAWRELKLKGRGNSGRFEFINMEV